MGVNSRNNVYDSAVVSSMVSNGRLPVYRKCEMSCKSWLKHLLYTVRLCKREGYATRPHENRGKIVRNARQLLLHSRCPDAGAHLITEGTYISRYLN